MAKFKVIFNSGTEEEIEADEYADVKTWIVFYKGRSEDAARRRLESVRLKASNIKRIERV